MAQDSKISELDSAGALAGTELLPIVQSGSTVKLLLSVLYTYFESTFKAATLTLTNKKITKRVSTRTYQATLQPNADSFDAYEQTAVSGALAIVTPTGTPTNFQELEIKLNDSGSNQTITWDAIYAGLDGTLPANTTTGKTTYLKFIYSTSATKWYCVINLTN